MKKRCFRFVYTVSHFTGCLPFCMPTSPAFAFQIKREFYEIKIYHLKTPAQAQRVDQYLKDAYIPALHRAGNKEGSEFLNRLSIL